MGNYAGIPFGDQLRKEFHKKGADPKMGQLLEESVNDGQINERRSLELANNFTFGAGCQTLVDGQVDILSDEPSRAISQGKDRPTGMKTTEVVQVICRIIRSVIRGSEDAFKSFLTHRNYTGPSRMPVGIVADFSLPHHQGVAQPIRYVRESQAAIVVEHPVSRTLERGRISLASMNLARSKAGWVV